MFEKDFGGTGRGWKRREVGQWAGLCGVLVVTTALSHDP